jgi:hypothetical protein
VWRRARVYRGRHFQTAPDRRLRAGDGHLDPQDVGRPGKVGVLLRSQIGEELHRFLAEGEVLEERQILAREGQGDVVAQAAGIPPFGNPGVFDPPPRP